MNEVIKIITIGIFNVRTYFIHKDIMQEESRASAKVISISFVKKYFLTYINCKSVTVISEKTLEIAAPIAPYFGINIKFNKIFINAPITYE